LGENSIEAASIYNNLGVVYARKLLRNKALESYLKALEIYEIEQVADDMYSQILLNVGTEYQRKGEFQKATDYNLHALRNNIDFNGIAHFSNAYLYDSSIYYYDKALVFEKELLKSDPRWAMVVYEGKAFAELGAGDEKSALAYIYKAKKLFPDNPEPDKGSIVLTLDLGEIHQKLKKHDLAIDFFTEAIELYENAYHKNHPILTDPYFKLSNAYLSMGKYDMALTAMQRSFESNCSDWKPESLLDLPTIDDVINKEHHLSCLQKKAEILKIYRTDETGDHYLAALLSTYDAIDQSIKFVRKSINTLDDKHGLQKLTDHVYEDAIDAYFSAWEKTGKKEYLQKCFYFSESSKNGVLIDAINTQNASDWASLPADLLKVEEGNKSDFAYYQSLLNEEKLKTGAERDSSKILLFEEKLYEANRTLDSLLTIFEEEHPGYFQLKYVDQVFSIADVQDKLKERAMLLEYFLGDSTAYLFIISKNDFVVERLSDPEAIANLTSAFREGISDFQQSEELMHSDKAFKISSQLHELLLKPASQYVVKNSIEDLVIVPDAELGYIPFELLLTKSVDEQDRNYANYPFLIKQYNIVYAYSSSLLKGSTAKKSGNSTHLSFAPSYEQGNIPDSVKNTLGKFRNELVSLTWNKEEVIGINDHFPGDILLDNRATEKSFKENAANASILHLAMHALIDDDQPMNSKLVFYPDKDSLEDGYLHTFELYNMKLNAELVVLSACETGFGKLIKGEGVISLARGFAYAGVPSMVMSHWQVDDQSTSILMNYFYLYLSEGYSKSGALRKAKLTYLSSASPNKLHPFFWGSFVIIGDDEPISESSSLWVNLLLIIPLLFFCGLIYVKIRKLIGK